MAVEKHRQGRNAIKSLNENGITYSNDSDILRIASNYYTNLYTSNNPSTEHIDTYMDNVNLPSLVTEKQVLCEGEISTQECENALGKIKRNKSPGEDGLPIEFYKPFWKELSKLLVDVYNESYNNDTLPLSMGKSYNYSNI